VSPAHDANRVAVLGTGALGSRIVEVLLARGTRVTVWNRTAERSAPLAAQGALRAGSALEAAASAPLVLLPLTDYTAVGEVLDAISAGIAGRTVTTLTTGSPDEARAAARQAEIAGAGYLDGGVQSGPETIGTEASTLLYSGPRTVFEQHRDVLDLLGPPRWVGEDPAAAAVQDLALFGLWYDAQIAYLRALDTVRSAGIDVEEFAPSAASQLGHVVAGAGSTAREVAIRSYPRGPADLTEHAPVLDALVELRRGDRLGDGDLRHIRALVRHRIEQGHGHDGLTGILD
jgi:3-hydroxyisobutyrate dehydrogenase-like beta-hydroxyacid dehydrogenase